MNWMVERTGAHRKDKAAMKIKPILSTLILGVAFLLPASVSHGYQKYRVPRYTSQVSARAAYKGAINRLLHRSRFEVREVTYYLVSPGRHQRPYPAQVQFASPNRLRTVFDEGQAVGISTRVQIGNTACAWHTGSNFRLIICSHMPWSPLAVSSEVNTLLVPLTLGHETFHSRLIRRGSGRKRRRITIIIINGRGDPLLCAPGLECPRPQLGSYHATLQIDTSTGLPIRFDSAVQTSGHIRPHQHAAFVYNRRLSIQLPDEKRVSCPSSVSANNWCLRRTG